MSRDTKIIFQKLLEHLKIQASSQKPREIKIATNQQVATPAQQPVQPTSKKVEPSVPIRNVFLFFLNFELLHL